MTCWTRWPQWDLMTAGVVLDRLNTNRQLSFFSAEEEPTVRALLDLLLGQHDEPRVPVTELVDQRLLAGLTDGWHYEDMPEDGEAWRRSLAALDEEARAIFDQRFPQLAVSPTGRADPNSFRRPSNGTISMPAICGACGLAMPAPPSIRIPGRGMRWVSVVPPTAGVQEPRHRSP